MKLEVLREFVVLSKYRNFTTAARELYITQPGLSNHMSAMEKELGFRVFERTLPLPNNTTIFMTHGHRYYVTMGINNLHYHAKDTHVNVVLFGHTHVAMEEYREGILFLNPGSCTQPRDGKRPSFAILDIGKNKITSQIVRF